ncbi:hypothetical protein J4526_01750 [Desulfurococcaceae archaeon MEX13E-LK6-19]|nr:hypothetical protein J4526_01750 [Desulfurococcaceae archaeon MEX13E-LK6-19]
MGRLRGLADPKIMNSFNTFNPPGLTPSLTPSMSQFNTVVSQTVKQLLSEETFRQGLRQYMFSRYVRDDARQRYNYLVKHLVVLDDPMYITRLTPSQAAHLLRGIAALREYLRLLGYSGIAEALDYYLKQLRKLAPRKRSIRLLDYEADKSIIDKALEQLRKAIVSRSILWSLLALIDFYTGLRGTELVWLWTRWSSLRKIHHNSTVIVELGYERRSKKAWITMMPMELAAILDTYMYKVTVNTIQDARDRLGIRWSLFRKAHLAILSTKLMEHEIDLLQGRMGKITVKHYTKHLREIADKYIEAYKPYLPLLKLWHESKKTAKQEQEVLALPR